MVLLNNEPSAAFPAKGVLASWESLRRARHNYYESRIRQSVEGIQKVHNGSFALQWLFPSFAQAGLAELEITRRLQKLGDYTPEEVAAYKQHNDWIKYHLDSTFTTPVPYCGGVFGLAILGFYLPKRWNVLNALALASLPPVLEILSAKWNPKHRFETTKFLDWVIEKRTAEVNMERFKAGLPDVEVRDFRRNYPDQTMLEAYNEYLKKLEN